MTHVALPPSLRWGFEELSKAESDFLNGFLWFSCFSTCFPIHVILGKIPKETEGKWGDQ